MTQEEYEAKVQSMPHELQETFREALEMSLSKRIVNRFMSTVMQAYALGQRAAQKESHDGAYMRGAEDMLEALRTVFDMDIKDADKYFNIDFASHELFTSVRLPLMESALKMNGGDILEIVDRYRNDKMQEKDERNKMEVQAMAESIGIEKLCQIAEEIRKQKAAEGECLPF